MFRLFEAMESEHYDDLANKDLNVTKLEESEQKAKSDEFSAIEEKIKEKQEIEKEIEEKKEEEEVESSTEEEESTDDPESEDPSEDDGSQDDSSSDETDDGSENNSDEDEPSEEEEKEDSEEEPKKENDDEPESKEDSLEEPEKDGEDLPDDPATEAFRNEPFPDINDTSYGIATEGSSDVAKGVLDSVANGLKWLGINVGIPAINKLHKGVIQLVTSTIGLVSSMLINVRKIHNRNNNIFPELKEKIDKARSAINAIEKAEDPGEMTFKNTKILNNLKISDHTDIASNIDIAINYTDKFVVWMDEEIRREIGFIKHLCDEDLSNYNENTDKVIGIELPDDFKQIQTDGSVNTYVSKTVLPGDVVVSVTITPVKEDFDKSVKALSKSKISLLKDNSSFKEIESIPHLNKEGLLSLLDELDKFCDVCEKHQQLYTRLESFSTTIKVGLKSMVQSLLKLGNKDETEKENLNKIYYKLRFINTVYLPACFDFQNYTAKLVNNSLNFVKQNIVAIS